VPGGGGEEKTEKATAKKRSDERKKGNVLQSKDITTVATLIASFYIMRAFMGTFFEEFVKFFDDMFALVVSLESAGPQDLMAMFYNLAATFALIILPPLLLISLVPIIATLAQTRGVFSTESLKFKFSRLNPIQGIQKLFSLRSIVELIKSLLKVVVILAILYNQVLGTVGFLPAIIDMEPMEAVAYAGETIMSILLTVGMAFVAIAAVDFFYQRYEFEKNLKMTKQEVKDEFKQMEGDPKIKGARRRKQMEMAQARMMKNVQDADVVVRNPTHYAVALRYKIDEDAAPVVLAKGIDHVAARIVEEAEKHGVALVENPPLARGLYKAAEIDEAIPAEFFQPVAELLAWLFSTKGTKNLTPDKLAG
jgi:flagellar biosynthetic protein FlhB